MSPVLTALRLLSKGHRSIRRFLKAEARIYQSLFAYTYYLPYTMLTIEQILPPLHEISHRPEEGDTLKSRYVTTTYQYEKVISELCLVIDIYGDYTISIVNKTTP